VCDAPSACRLHSPSCCWLLAAGCWLIPIHCVLQNWNKTTHPWNDLFGPELGFGFGMHAALPEQKILIVKTAWGGKNLSLDFRPPRSAAAGAAGKDPHCPSTKRGCGQVGRFYRTMLADVAAVLSPGVVGAMFPEWAEEEVSIGGFGWHQGWNDGCDKNMTASYESNLANLIMDLRDVSVNIAPPCALRGVLQNWTSSS
jgi:hypothetical protein